MVERPGESLSDTLRERAGTVPYIELAATDCVIRSDKPVVTKVQRILYLGSARDPFGKDLVAFDGSIRLNRKDFGLTWNAALETGGFLVGDEVEVTLSIEAARS